MRMCVPAACALLLAAAALPGDGGAHAARSGGAVPATFEPAFRLVLPGVSRDLPKRASLAAVGDVMLARSVGSRIVADGADVPFAGVVTTLRTADIAVANLESAIGESGDPAPKAYTFRAPPLAAAALAGAGIDVVSLANNHSLDYGPDALAETLALLDSVGVAHAGAGLDALAAHQPARIDRGGLEVAFLSYVDVPVEWGGFDARQWEATATLPGVAWLDVETVRTGVAAARQGADLVVVLMHFGFEGQGSPSETQRIQARAAIDAGAALVIGHHPHVLQPAEWYGGGLIVYSLGNFVFDGWDNPSNRSAILLVDLTEEGVAGYRMLPVAIDAAGLPWLAE